MLKVKQIRDTFIDLLWESKFQDNGTIEIIGAQFLADEECIFGKLNADYVSKELDWYKSMSRSIYDIREPIPEIWSRIASDNGAINSNYGWCIWSENNFKQFSEVARNLEADKMSRQGSLIYTRPSMHVDATVDGMTDFMCTYATQFIIRDEKLHHLVYMRSNDAVFGYKNDRAWQDHVHDKMLKRLKHSYPRLTKGDLIWNVASLHVYERHYQLVESML